MNKIVWLLIFIGVFSSVRAEDTIKLMHYNLMYYGKSTDFCNQDNNSIEKKNLNLKKIIQHEKPDVFSVNELDGNGSYPEEEDGIYLLNNALNTDEIHFYRKASFEETYLANTLFYNANKLILHSYQPIRMYVGNFEKIINAYTFYYRSKNLEQEEDTAYFTCFVVHLKAGNSYEDIIERGKETGVLMDYIQNEMNADGNYLIMGDLNVYYSDEPAFQNLINPSDTNYRFYDPAGAIGEWHNNSDFAYFHTQSTHYYGSCFSGGGLDDRFDFILASGSIMDNEKPVSYLENSYRTPGQDGQNYNASLNLQNNGSVPDDIAQALFDFSDHLPVSMKLKINKSLADILRIDTVFIRKSYESNNDSITFYTQISDTRERISSLELSWGGESKQYVFSQKLALNGNFYIITLPVSQLFEKTYFKISAHNKEGTAILESDEEVFQPSEIMAVSHFELAEKETVIAPNPVQDVLKIQMNRIYPSLNVQIGSLNGNLLINKTIKNNVNREFRLSVRHLPPGIYWLRIWKRDQLLFTKKVIIIK